MSYSHDEAVQLLTRRVERNGYTVMRNRTIIHGQPDMLVSQGTERAWFAVRVKAHATFTRKTGRLEHGISKRDWLTLQDTSRASGIPVFLAIIEEDTNSLLSGELSTLLPWSRNSLMMKGGQHQEEMVYFPRDAFAEVSIEQENDGMDGGWELVKNEG